MNLQNIDRKIIEMVETYAAQNEDGGFFTHHMLLDFYRDELGYTEEEAHKKAELDNELRPSEMERQALCKWYFFNYMIPQAIYKAQGCLNSVTPSDRPGNGMLTDNAMNYINEIDVVNHTPAPQATTENQRYLNIELRADNILSITPTDQGQTFLKLNFDTSIDGFYDPVMIWTKLLKGQAYRLATDADIFTDLEGPILLKIPETPVVTEPDERDCWYFAQIHTHDELKMLMDGELIILTPTKAATWEQD